MKLVFATRNRNKLNEIKKLLPGYIDLLDLTAIGCRDDIPETATTLEGNASLKSRYIAQKYNINCFSDDTGLEVDALNNAPGVYSARYAGTHCNTNDNIKKLLYQMQGIENRKAKFRTVISLIIDGKEHLFEGICSGIIAHKKQGEKGFGYDSIFIPEGMNKTFSQMSTNTKSSISHRGRATKKLITFLNDSHPPPKDKVR